MTLSFLAFSAAGPLMEGLLAWRLLKHRGKISYPYFSAYVFCDLACNLLLVAVAAFWRPLFMPIYAVTELVSVFSGFLIIWEVMRKVFPTGIALHGLARNMLLGIFLLVVPLILALGWRQADLIGFPYQYVPPAFEQYLTLAQAVLLMAVAALASYYGLSLGRNLRGLAFGFGVYLSLCAVNFASLQLVRGFLPYWQMLSPVLYIGLLISWVYTFWNCTPSPRAAAAGCDDNPLKQQWNHLWATTDPLRRQHN